MGGFYRSFISRGGWSVGLVIGLVIGLVPLTHAKEPECDERYDAEPDDGGVQIDASALPDQDEREDKERERQPAEPDPGRGEQPADPAGGDGVRIVWQVGEIPLDS